MTERERQIQEIAEIISDNADKDSMFYRLAAEKAKQLLMLGYGRVETFVEWGRTDMALDVIRAVCDGINWNEASVFKEDLKNVLKKYGIV